MNAWHHDGSDTDRFREPLYTRYAPPRRWRQGASLYSILNLDDVQLRRSIAVHEAGHAVLDLAYGIPVEEAQITEELGKGPGDGPAAWVKTCGEWSVPYMRYAAMCAAGERAQDRWMREQSLWSPERAWCAERTATQDRDQAVEALKHCDMPVRFAHPTGPGVHYRAIQDVADAALDHLWPRVLRVAEALDDAGHLTGAHIAHHAGMPGAEKGATT